MENSTVKASTLGQMVLAMRDSLMMEWDMAKAAGNQPRTTEIFTSALTKTTKRMDMAGMCGWMGVCTKAGFQTMLSNCQII